MCVLGHTDGIRDTQLLCGLLFKVSLTGESLEKKNTHARAREREVCPFSLFIFFSLFSLSLLFLKNFERRNAFYYDERDVGYDDFDEKRERERVCVCVVVVVVSKSSSSSSSSSVGFGVSKCVFIF